MTPLAAALRLALALVGCSTTPVRLQHPEHGPGGRVRTLLPADTAVPGCVRGL